MQLESLSDLGLKEVCFPQLGALLFSDYSQSVWVSGVLCGLAFRPEIQNQ